MTGCLKLCCSVYPQSTTPSTPPHTHTPPPPLPSAQVAALKLFTVIDRDPPMDPYADDGEKLKPEDMQVSGVVGVELEYFSHRVYYFACSDPSAGHARARLSSVT